MSLKNQTESIYNKDTPTLSLEKLEDFLYQLDQREFKNLLKRYSTVKQSLQPNFYLLIFQYLSSWQVQYFNSSPRLSKKQYLIISISHIKFNNLKSLNISNSVIKSVQPLTWIDCQSLQHLWLQNTQCSQFKCLQKTNFPRLQSLMLWHDCVKWNYQFEFISRMQFGGQTQAIMIRFRQEQQKPQFYIKNILKTEAAYKNFYQLIIGNDFTAPKMLESQISLRKFRIQ